MARFDRLLDILRVIVPPTYDDQFLAAATEEQLAVVNKPQVAGAQKRAGTVAREGLKRRDRFGRLLPVLAGDVRARYPYFPNPSRTERPCVCGSTMTICCPKGGRPQPTSVRTSGVSEFTGRAIFRDKSSAS